jgi:HTH-type transcriptional repressor of NAD biosynthesis genes
VTAPASAPPPLTPVVCLLGGESSGKTWLAQSLLQSLTLSHGLNVVWVPEYLRQWCEQHGRAPQAAEQAGIAHEQTRLIHQARSMPGTQLVIADTSALNIAVYSALYFDDLGLFDGAMQAQQSYTCHLVMGLDLPWVADGLFRDSADIRAQTDALLRGKLRLSGIPFHTVYGINSQRLNNALRALSPTLSPMIGRALVPSHAAHTAGRPGWTCEACSDPDCERRLFTSLVNHRPSAGDKP